MQMFLQFFAHYSNGYDMMDGSDWGWGFLMMLFWALVVIFVVVLIVRAFGGGRDDGHKTNDAVSIAKERYAKGEITKKEFEQLKKDLTSR
jgi:putative membrane protein